MTMKGGPIWRDLLLYLIRQVTFFPTSFIFERLHMEKEREAGMSAKSFLALT